MKAALWSPSLMGTVRALKQKSSSEMAQLLEDRGFMSSLVLSDSELGALKEQLLNSGREMQASEPEPWL